MRRNVGLAGAVVGVFAVAVLVGTLLEYLVGRIGGSQQGEQAAPSAPRSVTVEKTIPAATPAPTPPEGDTITATTPEDTTTATPPATATATASP
jgi:hypothetical protein